MKMKILPTMIAGIFIFNGAIAGEREFLFGPGKSSDPVSTQKIFKQAKAKTKKSKSLVAKNDPSASSLKESSASVSVQPKAKTDPMPATVATVAAVAAVAALDKPVLLPVATAPAEIAKMPSLPALKESKTLPTAPTASVAKVTSQKPESVSITGGIDPLVVREQLAKKLNSQINIGFFPSATRGNDSYNFLTSFMPLANYLSSQTGILVNFIPERNLKEYRQKISEARYPVIFINALLAREALAAGYKPVAFGQENLTPGYIVKDSSRLKKLEDIKNSKVAWSLNAQTSLLAMSDINRLGLTGNTFEDIGNSGQIGVLSAINSGAAEVGVWRANEMKKVAEESGGKLRLIGVGTSAPSSGVWVRGDLLETDFVKRMGSSLLAVNPESNDANAKEAALAFSKGFGVRGQFIPASQNLIDEFSEIFSSAKKSFPGSFLNISFDKDEMDKNMKTTVILPLVKTKVQDAMTDRSAIALTLKTQVVAGFFPSANLGNDNSNFVKNFMPLANYISQKTGVLINLIPERNITEYARKIDEYRYPLIFINTILSRNALAAGYFPLVVGKDNLSPGFMVRSDSSIKKLEDVKNSKIAWSINSQTSLLAMADINRLGLTGNTYSDVGSSGSLGALAALSSGAADVAIWSSSEFEKLNDPKFRYIGAGTSSPSSGVWVRSDLAETDFSDKVKKSLLDINPDSVDPIVKNVAILYAKGFGFSSQFIQIPKDFVNETVTILESAKKSFPDSFYEIYPDEKALDKNLAQEAITAIKAK